MKLEEIRKNAQKAHEHICDLASKGTCEWVMSIPAHESDSDLLLQKPLDDIETLLDMLDEAKEVLEFTVTESGTGSNYNKRARDLLEKWSEK